MTHLIKLELKKFGIAQNIIFMFAATILIISIFTNGKRKSRRKADSISCIYITAALIFKVNVFSDYTNR